MAVVHSGIDYASFGIGVAYCGIDYANFGIGVACCGIDYANLGIGVVNSGIDYSSYGIEVAHSGKRVYSITCVRKKGKIWVSCFCIFRRSCLLLFQRSLCHIMCW
jgi:hypothetical protein